MASIRHHAEGLSVPELLPGTGSHLISDTTANDCMQLHDG